MTQATLTYGGAGGTTLPELSQGSTGDDVRKLQEQLAALGYDVGEIDADYGPRTAAAVQKFQQDQGGLQVDAIAGPQTMSALLGETVANAAPTGKQALGGIAEDYEALAKSAVGGAAGVLGLGSTAVTQIATPTQAEGDLVPGGDINALPAYVPNPSYTPPQVKPMVVTPTYTPPPNEDLAPGGGGNVLPSYTGGTPSAEFLQSAKEAAARYAAANPPPQPTQVLGGKATDFGPAAPAIVPAVPATTAGRLPEMGPVPTVPAPVVPKVEPVVPKIEPVVPEVEPVVPPVTPPVVPPVTPPAVTPPVTPPVITPIPNAPVTPPVVTPIPNAPVTPPVLTPLAVSPTASDSVNKYTAALGAPKTMQDILAGMNQGTNVNMLPYETALRDLLAKMPNQAGMTPEQILASAQQYAKTITDPQALALQQGLEQLRSSATGQAGQIEAGYAGAEEKANRLLTEAEGRAVEDAIRRGGGRAGLVPYLQGKYGQPITEAFATGQAQEAASLADVQRNLGLGESQIQGRQEQLAQTQGNLTAQQQQALGDLQYARQTGDWQRAWAATESLMSAATQAGQYGQQVALSVLPYTALTEYQRQRLPLEWTQTMYQTPEKAPGALVTPPEEPVSVREYAKQKGMGGTIDWDPVTEEIIINGQRIPLTSLTGMGGYETGGTVYLPKATLDKLLGLGA